MVTETPDSQILELLRNDDSKRYGFNLLVIKYQQKIYWLVRRMVLDHEDANDITQNIFLKVWENLSSFRADSQLYTWIYRIGVNEALSFLKKKNLRRFVPFFTVEQKLSETLNDDNFFKGDEVQRKLQHALLKLPAKQRLVFNMKYFELMKYEEISEVTGTSVGALKASYHIAVRKIEEFLKAN